MTATPASPERGRRDGLSRQRLVGQQEVAEHADPDRERREEQRGKARLDPLLGGEDARVLHADLQEAVPRDAASLGPVRPAAAAPRRDRERRDEHAREPHAQAREPQRREVREADLDGEPRRAPHQTEREVHREAAAGEHGHGARIL